jgi:hypothetical protein
MGTPLKRLLFSLPQRAREKPCERDEVYMTDVLLQTRPKHRLALKLLNFLLSQVIFSCPWVYVAPTRQTLSGDVQLATPGSGVGTSCGEKVYGPIGSGSRKPGLSFHQVGAVPQTRYKCALQKRRTAENDPKEEIWAGT